MSARTAQSFGPVAAMPILSGEHAVVIFDDLSRISWTRLGVAQWQLLDIWPTPAQRSEVLRRARDGDKVLVIVKALPESESAFIEEIPKRLAIHAADIGEGLAEITVQSGDWLPRAVRSRLEAFIRAEAALRQRTPHLLRAPASLYHDRRTNLFFLCVDSTFSRDSIAHNLAELIESLTPRGFARKRSDVPQCPGTIA